MAKKYWKSQGIWSVRKSGNLERTNVSLEQTKQRFTCNKCMQIERPFDEND